MKWSSLLLTVCALCFFSCEKNKDAAKDVLHNYSVLAQFDTLHGNIALQPDQDEYVQDQEICALAVPKEGYVFSHWQSDNFTDLAPGPEFRFKISSDVVIKAVFQKEETGNPLYKLVVNYDPSMGSVTIDPDKDAYQLSEMVSVTAIPKEGYSFEGWSGGYSGVSKEMAITMTKDLEMDAVFQKMAHPTKQLLVQADIEYNITSKKWDFSMELEYKAPDFMDDERICDALVTVNGQEVECALGTYKKSLEQLEPGDTFFISVAHSGFAELNYKLAVPPYIEKEDFEYKEDTNILSVEWKALECDGYRVHRKLTSTGTGEVSYTVKSNAFTQNSIKIDTDKVWESDMVTTPGPLNKLTECIIWVTAMNRLENLDGLHHNSYIEATGQPSPGFQIFAD
jgi:hypothetical protein